MSLYRRLGELGSKYISKNKLFKYGFNLSPMYRRSTGRVTHVSPDLHEVRVRLPISYKNRNYANSIFGGSMFSAVDPFPMVQLLNILDHEYVVWDRSAKISFKKPAKETLFASFIYTPNEIQQIKDQIAIENEMNFIKTTNLTNEDGTIVYCTIEKEIYVADKKFFTEKQAKRKKGKHKSAR